MSNMSYLSMKFFIRNKENLLKKRKSGKSAKKENQGKNKIREKQKKGKLGQLLFILYKYYYI